MKNKESSKGLDLVKKIGYILIIMLIFTPLSFLLSNTLNGEIVNEYPDCYGNNFYEQNVTPEMEKINQDEINKCELEHEEKYDEYNNEQFITISIISIITILILLFFSNQIVSLIAYGLFFGSALNTIIIIMKESGTSSLLASSLGIGIFILLIIFINKNIKEHSSK